MKPYTKKQLNQVLTQPFRDKVTIDLRVEGKVRVTNSHWLVFLERERIGPDFMGYISQVPEGECKTISQSHPDDPITGPELDNVIQPKCATLKALVSPWIYEPFQTILGSPPYPLRLVIFKNTKGKEFNLCLTVKYIKLITDLFGKEVTVKVQDAQSPVYFYHEEELVSLVMPIRAIEEEWTSPPALFD